MRLFIALCLTAPSLASAACPNAAPLGVGAAAAVGTTVGSTDDYAQSCGFTGAATPDEAFEFTAPSDGFYTFDTEGSAFDTVLQLSEGDCTAAIACDDDGGTGTLSSFGLNLLAGETVVVVVSGYNGATGDFVLNVAEEPLFEPTCDVLEDLGDAVGFDIGSVDTCGTTDSVTASCTASSGNDALVSWTAPSDGVFTFSTAGTLFDTVLSAWEAGCGDEVACNDDYGKGTSSVTLSMLAGETVELRVDSYSSFSCGEARIHVLDSNCLDENMNARCDVDDAVLRIVSTSPGSVEVEVVNALPFSDVSVRLAEFANTLLPHSCHPDSTEDCLYLVNPRRESTLQADGAGHATFIFATSPQARGRTMHFQAVSSDGSDVRATDTVSTVLP